MTDNTTSHSQRDTPPLVIGIVAGESSGDQLGSRLMVALAAMAGRPVRFVGVGGPLMEAAGLASLFPMSDIAVNGIFPVLKRLRPLLQRMDAAARGIAVENPAVVIHIDAQDFNQRVAARLRRQLPQTPLIGYVSPTVWAWRPGRARKIAKLYSHLLAVLPFEPAVHARLGGPPTTYVGHPLMERLADLTPDGKEVASRAHGPFRLLLLPGSRTSEVKRLLPRYGEAVRLLTTQFPDLQVLLPAVPHLQTLIAELTSTWLHPPELILGEAAKAAAFRTARAAIAASGTVTLELALAGVPTVTTYRVSLFEQELGRLVIKARFASLPNLILDDALLPEFIDRSWTGADIAREAATLLEDGPVRSAQLDGFVRVRALMAEGIDSPSETAARIMLAAIAKST